MLVFHLAQQGVSECSLISKQSADMQHWREQAKEYGIRQAWQSLSAVSADSCAT